MRIKITFSQAIVEYNIVIDWFKEKGEITSCWVSRENFLKEVKHELCPQGWKGISVEVPRMRAGNNSSFKYRDWDGQIEGSRDIQDF